MSSSAENQNPNVQTGRTHEGGEPTAENSAESGDANLLNGDAAPEATPISSAHNTMGSEAKIMSKFDFGGPSFKQPAPTGNAQSPTSQTNSIPQPLASVGQQAGVAQVSLKDKDASTYFSNLSAQALLGVIRDRIHNFSCDLWIVEDISGAAILAHVAPSTLAEFLQHIPKIVSDFTRVRIVDIIFELVSTDPSIGSEQKSLWSSAFATRGFKAAIASRVSDSNIQDSPLKSNSLFQTPAQPARATPTFMSTPAFFGHVQEPRGALNLQQGSPSFLSEIQSTSSFVLDDTTTFTTNHHRASAAGAASSVNPFGQISITVNQPSATPPKYAILECCSDAAAFREWLRKNRKESLMALPVDRRSLGQLVSQDVKEEVSRIVLLLPPTNTFYFDEATPFPRSWPEVTDNLLLKILFAINGPRSASAAKEILKAKLFFFNDSTTDQIKFLAKVRKFCNEFKSKIKDFTYNVHQWPLNENLTKAMIFEAFAECFSSTEMCKGPDGTTMVPKCQNLAIIREKIREKKAEKLPLEEVIHFIIDHFERLDVAVRQQKGLRYSVSPWNVQGANKRRAFNQVQGGVAKAANHNTPRLPRCGNCGRKSHKNGERNCYLFGHAKGRGAEGSWAEGEASLKLDDEEWKTWKAIRDKVFYGYPENKKKKKEGQ